MLFPELTKKRKDLIARVAAALVLCALSAALIAAAGSGGLYGDEVNDALDNIYAVEYTSASEE
ncbi:MAG: hypothetical protein IJQ53_07050 [Clostridia bacterium]|nr:hypothetical protein [Clostridia bacterium]